MSAEAAAASSNPLQAVPDTAFHHVSDAVAFELPFGGELAIPEAMLSLGITKFVILQFIAFLLTLLIFVPLTRKIRNGEPLHGRFWNFWEVLCIYLRDEVVRPTIGHPHVHHEHGDTAGEAEGLMNRGHNDPLKET